MVCTRTQTKIYKTFMSLVSVEKEKSREGRIQIKPLNYSTSKKVIEWKLKNIIFLK